MMKARLMSLGSSDHYFPKEYDRPPRTESVPDPWADGAIMFEDFFAVGLRMPHTWFF
jgi:hypothetical protein